MFMTRRSLVASLSLLTIFATFTILSTLSALSASSDCFYAFGQNIDGAFGTGHFEDIGVPEPIAFGALHTRQIISIGASVAHSVVVDSKGDVFSFGSAESDALGFPGQNNQYYAAPITSLSWNLGSDIVSRPITEVVAGYRRVFVRENETGHWFAFGDNPMFTLGDGTAYGRDSPVFVMLSQERRDITHIASGVYHTLFLTADGTLYAVGACDLGQCGVKGLNPHFSRFPILVNVTLPEGDRIVDIQAGNHHVLALTKFGTVLGWGYNEEGEAGGGEGINFVETPTPIVNVMQHPREIVTRFAVGAWHNLLLTSHNRVICFGYAAEGQCGIGHAPDIPVFIPTEIDGAPLQGQNVTDLACGSTFSLLLTHNGELYLLGENIIGYTPVQFVSAHSIPNGLSPNEMITKMSAKHRHALLLTSEHRVLSMGVNEEGCMGVGMGEGTHNAPLPVNREGVLRGEAVTHMTAIGDHILLLNTKGTVLASGNCAWGRCMEPTSRSRPHFEDIRFNKQIYSISSGAEHSLIVTTDGQLWGGGNDFQGQLGSSEQERYLSHPTHVEALQKYRVIAAEAGWDHSIVLTANGFVFGMGKNTNGETGCGCNNEIVRKPTRVVFADDTLVEHVTIIAAGQSHNLILLANGTVFSWGHNSDAQLGVAPSDEVAASAHAVPVYIDLAGSDRIKKVSAGGSHSLALTHQGTVFCWGNNKLGACGAGQATATVYPPQRVTITVIDSDSVQIIDLSAGYKHSLLLASNGQLISFGSTEHGATGTGNSLVPVLFLPTLVDMSNIPPLNNSNINEMSVYAGNGRSFVSFCPQTQCGGLSSLHPLVCSERGECVSDDVCECVWGFNGTDCELAICSGEWEPSRACSGHGMCVLPEICVCDKSYSGTKCEFPECFGLTRETNRVCSSKGKCVAVDTCECDDGFFGPNCEEEYYCNHLPQSSRHVCSGNGKCLQGGICHCDYMFIGSDCGTSLVIVGTLCIGALISISCVACFSILSVLSFCGVQVHRKYKRVSREKEMTRELLQGFIRDEEMDEMDADAQRAKFIVKQAMMEVDFSELHNLTKIATGGSGAVVFKAEWQGETVAVKVFRSGIAAGEDNEVFFKEFEHELSLMSSLRHRNVISFLGCSLAFPRVALICEYCSQGSIEDMIKIGALQKLSSTEHLRMLLDIAEGCAFLHSRGVIHRDLKCANVLVDQNSVCRITDFGLAKYTKEAQNAHTTAIGTSYYVAPEMWTGDGTYSESVDAYSYAILSMEILLGRLCPFPGMGGSVNVMQVQSRAAADPLYRPDLNELPPKYSFLKWMLQACWDEDSTKRPPFRDIVKILKSSLYDVGEG